MSGTILEAQPVLALSVASSYGEDRGMKEMTAGLMIGSLEVIRSSLYLGNNGEPGTCLSDGKIAHKQRTKGAKMLSREKRMLGRYSS